MSALRAKKFVFYLMIVVSLFGLTYIIFKLNAQNAENADVAYVLFWNSFFLDRTWSLPKNTNRIQCGLNECIFTNQHGLLPNVNMYDAVVFHMASGFVRTKELAVARNPKQAFVFAVLESPEHTWHTLSNEHNFYNLTMTYRLDSDIVWSYKEFLDKESDARVAPSRHVKWLPEKTDWTQTDDDLLKMIGRKTKMIAWFVSNCNTKSKREKLVEKLKIYVPVDIFGSCGPMKCERGSQECNQLLDNDYKFYLSFENSLCTDYVTEKLFNAMNRDVIPVVFGGANYSYFAPPHSYIDVQDFPNVKSLAEYLLHLHNHPLEYAKYFWWRRYYKLSTATLTPFCDLCNYISSKALQNHSKSYNDIEAYWKGNACKRQAKIKF